MKETSALQSCSAADHAHGSPQAPLLDEPSVDRCSRIFRALGDLGRMRLVARLVHGAFCVGDLAVMEEESVTTISQRLRVLRADNIVHRKRDGKHILYSLADQHMFDLIRNGLAHAAEPSSPVSLLDPTHNS